MLACKQPRRFAVFGWSDWVPGPLPSDSALDTGRSHCGILQPRGVAHRPKALRGSPAAAPPSVSEEGATLRANGQARKTKCGEGWGGPLAV